MDTSARPSGQRLVTLHERRGPGDLELVATFYEPGTVESVVRTIEGFGRNEAVVAVGAPPDRARSQPMRACESELVRRGVPVRAAAPEEAATGVELLHALAALDRYAPEAAGEALTGPVGAHPLRHGRLFETYPDAIFCALLGHRPPEERTPWNLQQRIAALKLKGVVDEDGGLWHRTVEELDACAAAYAAYALAAGLGTWVGDPEQGVVVLPTTALLTRYEALPPPARSALARSEPAAGPTRSP